MAAPYNPPVKNEDFIIYIALEDTANPGSFLSSPPLATSDFKVSKTGGALADLGTLPSVEPAASIWVKITLSATEMNTDLVSVQCIDQTVPKAWADFAFCIPTVQ